jgi:TP901 family phage tail tape measure protein
MANDKTLSFGVEFISKGLSKIDGDLVNTFKRVGELEQAASVVFKGNDVALVKAQKGYKALSKEVQSLSEEVKATTDDFDKFKRSAAADDKNNPTWKAFTETLANLNTKLAAVTGTFKGFNDQLSGTAKGANVNIQNLLTTMKSLGVSDTILSSLKDKLASVNTILTTTGKGTQLNKLSRDMEKYYANIIKVEEATKKLSSLDIKSPDKNKVLSTLTTSKDKIASGDLNQQQINALLKKSDDLYKSLSVTQSELLTKQKEAKSLLQSDITLLEAKRNLLVASAAAQKNSASKEDLKAAEKVVALLDDEIAKRKALLTLTPTAVTPKATATYVSKITAGTSNTAGLVDKAIETKEDVNLSKNFVNAREAAKSLLLEVDRIGASLRNTSSGTINAIKAQIDAISVNLNNKTKGSAGSPASASAELTDLNKKLGLLKLINEYENNVEANANLNTADKTLGLANLESLRNELVITGSSITILKDKFNSFKKSLDNKVAVDVGFDQTIRKYTEQIGALERLKNAKTNWATDKSLLAAQEQIDKLGRELTKVREEKAKFDASFATSTNLSTTVKEGSASLQNLNKSLVSSTEATRHLNAQLSETSFSKWIQNIGGRVLAYSSLYMGITQVTQAMSAGVAYTLEYDQAIHTLSAVLDMSSESAGRLEKRLAGLSVKFGGTLKDINEAALTLGRAGFDKAEVATATENIIKMARLTGDSFATSASALITYKEVFGDVKDAITGTTPSVEDLSNTLAYMANQSRMSTQDIGTFSNYALAAARSSGMTANAVSAMAISFSNAGVNASTIGTQIRRFSSVLSETSGEVTSFFKAIGTDQEIMIARMKMGTEESNKAMAEFVAKLKGLSDNDFGRITRGMDILALQSITLLRNNADNFFLHLRKLNAGVNGEIDKANFITESYAITWEKLGNSLALSFKNTVGALLPFAQAATEFAIGALDKFNYTITAIRENWDKFRIAMQVVLGALAGAAIVGAAIRITAALGTITAGATGASAAMAVLQGLMTAISRHPIAAIVVGITSVAIGMAAAFGESKDAVVTLDDKITKTQDKIRELIKLKQNASVTEAYKIELKITAAQLEVDNLTKALNINSAILDSKSSVKDATIMMTAYANQKNPELLAVSGGKAQSAMTSALDANIASLTGILKATNEKDIKRITEISDFISQLELAKKSIQSADFSTVANQKNMDTWALSLKNMTTQTDVLAERFKLMAQNPNATGPAVIPNAKGIYSLKDDTAANQKEMLKVTEANYARAGADLKYTQEMINNTQFLATQISRLEKGFDKQYQITSSGRAGDKGQHGVSGAVDIQLANVDEGKRMQKYMEQNPDIFKGVGQVILEVMEATGKAVMHIAVDASGKGMRFYQGTVANMKTTLSGPAYSPTQKFSPAATTSTASPAFNAPNLVQDKGAISVKSGATQVQTLVSPEYINLLTSAASKYESLYNSNVNVTGKTKELSAELANTISKLSKTEIAMLQNTIDAVPEAGKALARQFMNDITKAGSDPIAAGKAVEKVTLEAENYSKTANPDLEKQKALDAVVSASKKYVESHQQILTLTEAKARLDTLGLLDKHVMTKLLKEDNVQVREVTRLMAEQLTQPL